MELTNVSCRIRVAHPLPVFLADNSTIITGKQVTLPSMIDSE